MSMSSESDEKMMATNDKDSPASDDANSGINAEGNDKLKKGPWTSAEDAILVDYVTKNGAGNWNAILVGFCFKNCSTLGDSPFFSQAIQCGPGTNKNIDKAHDSV